MVSSENDILPFLIDWLQDRTDTEYPKQGIPLAEITAETIPFAMIDSLSSLEFIFDIELEFYPDDKRISKFKNRKTMTMRELAEYIKEDIE